jgi:mannose-6-phosphate isomerase class I
MVQKAPYRKTEQALLPALLPSAPKHYRLYPHMELTSGVIELGYEALAETLSKYNTIILEGYSGVLWEDVRQRLESSLNQLGKTTAWHDVRHALKDKAVIDSMTAPHLGDDPVFAMRYPGTLADFFDEQKLGQLRPAGADITIVYGAGASLTNWQGFTVFLEVPKNEIQFRSRAQSITNLFEPVATDPKQMYKQFYFLDWVVLNRHKAALLPKLGLVVDTQRQDTPTFMSGETFRQALQEQTTRPLRVRPWFEPGAWGGQRLESLIPDLPQNVPNYAWSFEAIMPENGLIFSSDHRLFEVSFDWLMMQHAREVLGQHETRFGQEFPIRFNFLDTFEGGNLSLQCHPTPEYIKKHFGETFTQDETYYILDSKDNAKVYLGFHEDIDPQMFREVLEHSQASKCPVEVEHFVQTHPANKHELFLIPHGTIHASGKDVLVLEISATPYIFTFKVYDWLRLDLDGKPRPINIARAFDNLNFGRKGELVTKDLIAKARVINHTETCRVVHLATHPDHFYDVHRLEFQGDIAVRCEGSCHVLSLVEGDSITLEANGSRQTYYYLETIIIPAAVQNYRLISQNKAKVVKAFLKDAQ